MNDTLKRLAWHDAQKVRNKAFLHQLLHSLRGIPNELLPFDAVKALHPDAEAYRGHGAIEVDKIVGSVDRYRDFDHHFLPLVDHILERWSGIRHAVLKGRELPAIQVYRVGSIYFVKDGHHRVSVARSSGQKYIDAEIIELHVKVPPDEHDTVKTIIIKGEYALFLDLTALGDIRPNHYPVLFTVPGRYDVLLEHVSTSRYYRGLSAKRAVPWEDAVAAWYDELYVPLVDEIREHEVLRRFPGRTEADLYLWIMDHRYYLAERYGFDIGSEGATLHFADNYSPDVMKWLWLKAVQLWSGEVPATV